MKNCISLLLMVVLLSCGNQKKSVPDEAHEQIQDPFEFEYTVEAAPEWTDLFYRKSGWFGGDGIFSMPLNGFDQQEGNIGNRTFFIFGDTYIGEVENDKPLPGNTMVNNSVAYIEGIEPHKDSIHFHYKTDASGKPQTFFVPDNVNAKPGQYFWPGDGFINRELNDNLYLFTYHVDMTGPNVFDFALSNVTILAIENPEEPPFQGYRQIASPLNVVSDSLGNGEIGSGILVNTQWAGAPNPDGYVYVYGCIGPDKNLVASRVKPKDFENFDSWSYWTGESWSSHIKDLGMIVNAVSNELSVTPLKDGRYLLVFQVLGISDKVGVRIGTSPVGPFGPIHEIWTTPEIDEGLLPYNAKAHPNLSRKGELLISYNTITFDFWKDIQENAHIYRPRFIRLKSDVLN